MKNSKFFAFAISAVVLGVGTTIPISVLAKNYDSTDSVEQESILTTNETLIDDNYDEASGTMIFSSDDENVVNTVEFQTKLSESLSYSKYDQIKLDENISLYDESTDLNDLDAIQEFEEIVYCADDEMIDILTNDQTYQYLDKSNIFSLDDATPIDDDERISTAEDGIPIYNFRNDPTNVLMSSMCLFPQDMAYGFLENQDLWEVDGTEEYNGLLCYKISGKTKDNYGEKLNVSTFDF